MIEGMGMTMMSMKILSAQDVRINVRESMHLPPGMRVPSGRVLSIAGRFHAYWTGSHCSMFTRLVLMPYMTLIHPVTNV